MKIKLIDKQTYDKIVEIQKNHPKLTFNNKGYEYIQVEPEDRDAFEYVADVLKAHILGFSQFNNFKDTKDGIMLRLQYDCTAEDRSLGIPFTGVGYILLDELLNGFSTRADYIEKELINT